MSRPKRSMLVDTILRLIYYRISNDLNQTFEDMINMSVWRTHPVVTFTFDDNFTLQIVFNEKKKWILRYILRRNCLHMFCSHFRNVLYLSCYLTLWTSDFDFVFVFVTQGLSAEVVGDVDDCGCGPGDNEIARAVHWNNQRKWYLHCRSNPPVHYTVLQSPTVHSATTTYHCISAFLQSYQHFCHYRLINGNNGKNFRNLLLYPWIWDL